VSVAVEVATSAAGVVEHRPWWQRRLVLSGAIVGLMLVLYFALRGEYPWPGSLQWNSLGSHLDNFQAWLLDQRNAAHPNVVFRAFNGFATFLDDLVTWLNNLFHWLTWVGTTVVGVAVVLRFGGGSRRRMMRHAIDRAQNDVLLEIFKSNLELAKSLSGLTAAAPGGAEQAAQPS